MKLRIELLIGLGLLMMVATVLATSSVVHRIPADKHPQASPPPVALAPETTPSGPAAQAADDAARVLWEATERQSLLDEVRLAKHAGRAPAPELYRRLRDLTPSTPGRGSGHLDQGGETCAGATVINAVPYSDAGTTTGYLDDHNADCGGSGGASPDVVYVYTPAATNFYHITLCGSMYDTRLLVFADACVGEPVACNDDDPDCWPSSTIPSVELLGGTNYYIVIDGYGDGSYGDYVLALEEMAPPPTGDVCDDPIVMANFPFHVDGANSCDYRNDYSSTTCLNNVDAGPDVIYSFTLATATSVEIILNAYPSTTPPMEQYVWPGILLSDHCPPDWNCIASASNMTADLLYLSCSPLQPGTYYVMVDNCNWFQPCFTYDLTVQTCGPCDITAQPGDVNEAAEPFPLPGTFSVNDPNGGCNNADPYVPQYQDVQGGQTVFGRTFAYTDSVTGSLKVDSDWYRLQVTAPSTLTCTYNGESMLRVALLQPPCPGLITVNGVPSTPCTAGEISQCLEPGEYWIRILRAGTYAGPDPVPFDYRATFTLTPCQLPLGRCCYDQLCADNTRPECVALGGVWFAGMTCENPCPILPPNDNCQNAGPPVPLPATFTGTNVNSTNDCPLYEADPQVWHVFETTEMSDIQVDYCGTQNFHSFSPWLYNGCPCAQRTQLDVVDWGQCSPTAMTGIWRNLPAGIWYVSVFYHNPNSIGEYTIHVNAISSAPPVNDECATATPLTLVPNGSVTVTGTTLNANATCPDVCYENGFDYNSTGPDVFYSLTVTEGRRVAIALGIGDMHLSVYQGQELCCASPAWLCNDDDANFLPLPSWDVPAQHPGNSASYVAAAFEPGTYLIRVAKYGNQLGYYTLTLYDNGSSHCAPPVANDVTVYRVGDMVEVRWSTDEASAARGTYNLYTNTSDAPVGDPSWIPLVEGLTPVVGPHHLYYSASVGTAERRFYYVTGVCTDEPGR